MVDPKTSLLVIICAAAVTYSLRLGGLLMAGRLPKFGRVRRFMDAVPGTILLALVAPGIASSGVEGWVAAVLVLGVTLWTRNVMLAMFAGVLLLALFRQGLLAGLGS